MRRRPRRLHRAASVPKRPASPGVLDPGGLRRALHPHRGRLRPARRTGWRWPENGRRRCDSPLFRACASAATRYRERRPSRQGLDRSPAVGCELAYSRPDRLRSFAGAGLVRLRTTAATTRSGGSTDNVEGMDKLLHLSTRHPLTRLKLRGICSNCALLGAGRRLGEYVTPRRPALAPFRRHPEHRAPPLDPEGAPHGRRPSPGPGVARSPQCRASRAAGHSRRGRGPAHAPRR
ncbi:hypothetical protein MTDSW087_05330 [Methylobacterium dankookense]|uniref:Uncharacterized protein n=1 Tax=Methylobacterium dankookense TaxID=560405 RepID=A0A564G5K0_9HYPH|nr:hypothetical protein IFDJLNFL_5750 [Methylobacterium dankookense]VUF15587.1 hypothetical protein MTDSW087_05330 [Methylobacterium dankookense]